MYKGRLDEATAKAELQSMPERELANLIEGYAQRLNTRVYRTCKEIANKCYEAVMAIKSKKATGYGRSPQEANINCLKKLAEVICEDGEGMYFMEESFEKLGWMPASQPVSSTITVKPAYFGPHFPQQKPSGDQPDVSKENPVRLSLHDSKFDLRCKNRLHSAKNPFTNKNSVHSKSNTKVPPNKQPQSPFAESKCERDNPRVSHCSKATDQQQLLKEQLVKAQSYIEKLQAQLKCFADQNKVLNQLTKYLREAITEKTEARRNRTLTETQKNHSGIYQHDPEPVTAPPKVDYERSTSKFKSCANNDASFDVGRPNNISFAEQSLDGSFMQDKKKVPRLNLKLLPNYHGNSNKSLNQSLLLNYEKMKKK